MQYFQLLRYQTRNGMLELAAYRLVRPQPLIKCGDRLLQFDHLAP